MPSKTDPKKLKALLNSSADDPDDEDEGGGAGTTPDAETEEGDTTELDEGEEADDEITVESLTKELAPALATINEIIDEFRTGSDAQPNAGVEQLEEELDAKVVHDFSAWTVEAGKKDFRKLAQELGVEDEDGFVGLCRAIRKNQEDGEHTEGSDKGDEGGGEEEAGEEEDEEESEESGSAE